jgi:hypothetical protein
VNMRASFYCQSIESLSALRVDRRESLNGNCGYVMDNES